jgi:glycosyltransferase involved in cell wall biosynthesis
LEELEMITLQTPTQVLPDHTRNEPNRFLFIASDLWLGGIAAYIDSLARGLMSLGDTVKVLAVTSHHQEGRSKFPGECEPWVIPFQLEVDHKPTNWLGRKCVSLLDIFRCLSLTCRRVLEKTPLFKPSTNAIARFEKLLSEEKPTAIVFANFDARLYPLVFPLLEKEQPYGIIAHGTEVGRLTNSKAHDLACRGLILRRASWIVANSHYTKSLLEAWGIPSERIKLVPPPISEEAIMSSATSEPKSRKDGALSLVTICRLVRGKGVDLVLRALKILAARGIPYRYVIGGEGPERVALEALVDELELRDKVHFMGSVVGEEKWRLLGNADVFVMPSRFDPAIPWKESFGIAFAEAAAFGVPAVASRSGGIPDAVLDGETGILVPEESHGDIADALTLLYQKPEIRKRLGSAARERARSLFSPAAVVAQFTEAVLDSSVRS